MRVLILSNEVWNDKINGNNVTSNWFEGMNAEFANIYCEPGAPYNKCCRKYFQITDMMMFKSLFTKEKAGKSVDYQDELDYFSNNTAEQAPKRLYECLRKISGSFLRLVRELLWIFGKYDRKKINQFITTFQPDVIFSERMASCKMLRLEKIVHSMSKAPFYAFTGDDEYSLKQLSFSPFFWINRFMVRRRFRCNIKFYKIYYTLSIEQAEYYERIFNCKCKVLQKCGEFSDDFCQKDIHKPIKIVYAGKFYCNRWKVLAEIVKAISVINQDEQKITLQIFTKDIPNKRQKALLDDGINSIIMGAVSQVELIDRYKDADIAIHVESRDIKNRLITKYSYSTKIVDCLFSGCAVLAFCWKKHSGLTSLKKEEAALCVSTYEELVNSLEELVKTPEMLKKYQEDAYNAGVKFHNRKKVQEMLLNDFCEYNR